MVHGLAPPGMARRRERMEAIMMRRIAYVLLVAGVLYACGLYARNIITARQEALHESDTALAQKVSELESLRAEAAQLEAQVNNLDVSDPVEVEAAIRRNKRLVREGETLYRIQLLENSAGAPMAVPVE
jgi:cell division protein FtsB